MKIWTREKVRERIKEVLKEEENRGIIKNKFYPKIKKILINKPELHDDPCDNWDKQNRELRSYNPNSTYYIHSCENQRVICIEQRSFLSIVASTMEATCYLLPRVHQLPSKMAKKQSTQLAKNRAIEVYPSRKNSKIMRKN